MEPSLSDHYPYDIAISFAGENREIALQLFELLIARHIKVFYDFNEEANLWGKDLIEHLTDVYSNRARYCLMLISEYYPKKPWTNLERRSAQARALRQPEEYILPVRLDDTEVPGFPSSVSYLDLRHQSVEEVADQVVKKLGKHINRERKDVVPASEVSTRRYNIPLPQVEKSYTQLDKDRFIEGAFNEMRDYFLQALSDLKSHYSYVETDFKEITTEKFLARVYVHGEIKCACKIWLGSSFGSQSI